MTYSEEGFRELSRYPNFDVCYGDVTVEGCSKYLMTWDVIPRRKKQQIVSKADFSFDVDMMNVEGCC